MRSKILAAMVGLIAGLSGVAWGKPNCNSEPGDYVVLLHGLGRSHFSMMRISRRLAKENYRVINVSYPSTRLSIEAAAQLAVGKTLNEQIIDHSVRVHFVTHSLGGILLRQYLARQPIENLGRVVMLAPPSQGSELADKLKRNWLYRLATGPSGQQLGTDEESVPLKLGPANFELGIVAGSHSLNPIFSHWIPGSDDGKVSVARTQLEGMQDFLVVPYSHTWMAWRKPVIEFIATFLRTGQFSKACNSAP